MAPGYPPGIGGSFPNGYFSAYIKDIDNASYYANITSIQQYLALFFRALRGLFLSAAFAKGQGHVVIMTNDR